MSFVLRRKLGAGVALEGIAIVVGLVARLEEVVDSVLEEMFTGVAAKSLESIYSVSRTVSGCRNSLCIVGV